MSVALLEPKTRPQERLLTVAEFAAIPERDCERHELDNGRLVTKMSPPGDLHGAVESNLVYALKLHGEKGGHGKVRCGEAAIILWRNPDRVVGADAAFIANTALPVRRSPEGYLETIPELVVEVVSKNDTPGEVRQKIRDYLKAGVKLVLVADPKRGTVVLHRAVREPEILKGQDPIRLDELIPGFKLTVAEALAD